MDLLNSAIIGAKVRMMKAKESFNEFMTSEKGVSNIVATILIILVVVAMVALLWSFLGDWMVEKLKELTGWEPATPSGAPTPK